MDVLGRLRATFNQGDAAAAPAAQQAQPNAPVLSDPVPQSREVGGALAGLTSLKRHLPGGQHAAPRAPMPHSSPLDANQTGGGFGVALSPFYAQTSIRPTHTAPAVVPRPNQIRTEKPGARMPMHVESQRKTNIQSSVGKTDPTQADANLELHHEGAADTHLQTLFPTPPALAGNAAALAAFTPRRAALMQSVRDAIPAGARGQPPLAKARYLGHALAEATGGDVTRAEDALGVLQGRIAAPTPQQSRDAFATRCVMARSRASFNALRDVEAAPVMGGQPQQATALDTRVHADADWQTWRAAGTLLDAWPASEPRPATLDDLAQSANAMLPAADREPGVPVANGPNQAVIGQALSGHTQAAMAMLCGRALLADPRAQPETRFRAAYFSHRNGIAQQDVGQVQTRLFSVAKHAKRNATNVRTGSWMSRTAQRFKTGVKQSFGHEKDPLSTLSMGTAGGLLDHPDKDFSTLQSIDTVVNQLNATVVAAPPTQPGHAPDAAALEAAVRASALRHWKLSIGTKGWLRDDTKFGRFQRNRIASDVATALHTDKHTVRNSPAFQALPTMNAATLDAWATASGADMNAPIGGADGKSLRQNLDRMKAIRQDPVATPATPQGNIDSLCDLIDNVPRTYSVQMSSGGVYGLDANISENFASALGIVGAPSASVAPDVRYLKGRHAVVEVGSTSHHGELFVGTDDRRSAHIGVGGFIGWSLAGGKVMASGYGSLIGGRDTSNPRGVVIRTPFDQTANPGDANAWRNKMSNVVRTLGTSGAGGQLPQTKDEMWNGLAHEFFADPDLSVGWIDNHSRTHYGALSATGGARYVTPANVKFGPLVSAEAVVGTSKAHVDDASGSRTVDKSSSSFRAAVNGSATLVASPLPTPVSNNGPFNSISFSSAPLFGVGTTMLQTGTGSTLRLYEVDGDIQPERTYRDTEFTRVGNYLKYVDSRNPEWLQSVGGDQRELNTYQSQVKLNAVRGNQFYGERQRMRPEAAAEINAYRGALRMLEHGDRTPTDRDKQEMQRMRGEIGRLLGAPGSWTNHALYTYESNSTQRTRGLSYVFAAQSVKQVSAQRELSALSARP